jgi:hypothetical protein
VRERLLRDLASHSSAIFSNRRASQLGCASAPIRGTCSDQRQSLYAELRRCRAVRRFTVHPAQADAELLMALRTVAGRLGHFGGALPPSASTPSPAAVALGDWIG